jgi:hypothetical protein
LVILAPLGKGVPSSGMPSLRAFISRHCLGWPALLYAQRVLGE